MAKEKKTPQRAAAGGKGATAKASKTEKAAKILAKAVVGANITDEALDKFWMRHAKLKNEMEVAKEPVRALGKRLTALNKEISAAGISTDGFKMAYKVSQMGEGGNAVIGWYVRIAKRKSLPGSGMQLDLLDPVKNAKVAAPPLVDAEKLPTGNGHANGKSNGNGAHSQTRAEQLKDLEENGFHQGVAAKAIKVPKALEKDEDAVAALKVGYARGQKQNADAIKGPNKASAGKKAGKVLRGAFH